MRLLIVDDNPALRRLVRRVVGNLADEMRECSDGAEALQAFRQYCPDLVLMDIEMIQVDGITATREIIAACPEAKVVIVSRHDDEQTRDAARLAGACGYVLKENLLDLRELIGRIVSITEGRNAFAPPPCHPKEIRNETS